MKFTTTIVLGLAVLSTGCRTAKIGLSTPASIAAKERADRQEWEEEEARERKHRGDFEKQRLTDEEKEAAMKGARAFDRLVQLADEEPFALTNAPSNWRPVGAAPMTVPKAVGGWGSAGGFVGAVAVSPINPNLILAGTVGGLWRSVNGGQNFTPVSRNQEYRDSRAIAFAPSDPRIVYAGFSNRDASAHGLNGFGGFLISNDGGGSWVKPTVALGAATGYPVGDTKRILVHPSSPNRVWAAVTTTAGQGSVVESADGGNNWASRPIGDVSDIEFHPSNPSIIYVAVKSQPNNGRGGVFRSTDGGGTFTPVFTVAATIQSLELAVTPAATNDLFVFMATQNAPNPTNGTIRRLTFNAAGTPSIQDLNLPATTFNSYFQIEFDPFYEVDPVDPRTQYFGAYSVYKSTDAGRTWADIGNDAVHPDQHSLAWLGSSRSFLVGNDGGISKTTDAGGTFKELNNGLQALDMVGFNLHPTDASASCTGLFHNGFATRSDSKWEKFAGGDGGACIFDPKNPDRMMVAFYANPRLHLRKYLTPDFISADEDLNIARMNPNSPLVHDGSRIYYCDHRVWFTDTGGPSLEKTSSGDLDLTRGGTDSITALGVTRADQKVLFVGSRQGRLMVSRDGGANWTDRSADLARALGVEPTDAAANRAITSIAVDPTYPDTAVLGFGGTGGAHVLRTNTFGANWENLSGGARGPRIPDAPVNALMIDPLDNAVIYAATEMGVYRQVYGTYYWSSFSRGLPRWVATGGQAFSFRAKAEGGTIQLGTRGAGAFQLERQKPCELAGVLGLRNVSESLTDEDCISPVQPSLARAKRFRLAVGSGRATVRVTSRDFDPYVLAVHTGGLAFVEGENDDDGGSLNSRLELTRPGVFTIEVTSINVNARGAFQIEVTGDGVLDELTFNPRFYEWKYDRLCGQFQGDDTGLQSHFVFDGLPGKFQASPVFDVDYYLRTYPEVNTLTRGDPRAALAHWLSTGIAEGRRASREFSPTYYIINNPDVAELAGNLRRAMYHWLTVGIAEKRRGSAEVDFPAQFQPARCAP